MQPNGAPVILAGQPTQYCSSGIEFGGKVEHLLHDDHAGFFFARRGWCA